MPEYLDYWARMKGITVVGTGDFTHPGWCEELKEKLEPAEPGLFKLKGDLSKAPELQTPFLPEQDVRFILSAEISSIYKKKDKVRKVHNVILAPDFATVEKIQQKLTAIGGNITSDGRPILGLDSRDLLELALEASEDIFFIPAHIWTPWFSALGDKSGFETIKECYDDLADHIYAVETGLSSDPPMNWLCSFLDNYVLLSNSDAHSPEKLGREANLFNTNLSYQGIVETLKDPRSNQFLGTIEFFPQEGKYHYDGHRKCDVLWDPVETIKHNRICPQCGKKITVGVMHRVMELADRQDPQLRPFRHPFFSLISLKGILSEILQVGANSKKVSSSYISLLKKGTPELSLLLDTPEDVIKTMAGEELAEAIRRMRNREIIVKEGFDGEYGQIKVFDEHELKGSSNQQTLFRSPNQQSAGRPQRKLINFNPADFHQARKNATEEVKAPQATLEGLNRQQQQATNHLTGPALIVAGPGTGKTHVLTRRIASLINNHAIPAEDILAITFTNRAANEMKERLKILLPDQQIYDKVTVSTFHALGYTMLTKHANHCQRQNRFSILDEGERESLLLQIYGQKEGKREISNRISLIKQNLTRAGDIEDAETRRTFQSYQDMLQQLNAFDLDDLILWPVKLLERQEEIRRFYQQKYRWIMVDEYQDINSAQYQLLRLLTANENGNLFVIGDANQAIYGFRGADVRLIRRFKKDFPAAEIFQLATSYRCSNTILKASDRIIGNQGSAGNPLQGLQEGVKVRISRNTSAKSEAEFIARAIEKMMGGLRFFSMDSNITSGGKEEGIESLADFAILCRLSAQMEPIQEALNNHSIPYQSVGKQVLFQREPVKSLLDLLRLHKNPANTLLKEKLLNKKTIPSEEMAAFLTLPQGQKSVKELLESWTTLFFPDVLPEGDRELQHLLSIAEPFDKELEAFLKQISLRSSSDSFKFNVEQVALTTIHAAKGLEFKCVFVPGCEAGVLPYTIFPDKKGDIEEEQRLLYVAMTRAQNFLFLCHADKRFLFGKEYQLPRSPFLNTIGKKLLEATVHKHKKQGKPEDKQLKLFDF